MLFNHSYSIVQINKNYACKTVSQVLLAVRAEYYQLF
jgi:hypothetical protein